MLNTPIEKAIATTKDRVKKLNSMGIFTISDILMYFPNRYEDLSEKKNIRNLQPGELVTIEGTLDNIWADKSPKQGMKLIKAILVDKEDNQIELVWFNQQYLLKMYKPGDKVTISGKVKGRFDISISSPKIERTSKKESVHTGRLVPVYPESEPISSTWLREKIHPLLYMCETMDETLPPQIVEEEDFISRGEAIKQIHFPESNEALEQAKRRLTFEELFVIQLSAIKKKLDFQKIPDKYKKEMTMNTEFITELKECLPFELTGDQRVAIYEILTDIEQPYPMHRLLEGDVGSGKTIVAFIVMLHINLLYGYQCALMAPTEILARQHLRSLQTFLNAIKENLEKKKFKHITLNQIEELENSITYLIGSLPTKQKKEIQMGISTGHIKIVIGTHALIQESVDYHNLGLVIIDEQHRFGVEQRDIFKAMKYPHILHMTATPIPRSLALTMYGDQDLSIIEEKPANRKDIITKVVYPSHRVEIYNFCKEQIRKGRQIFVICPLVEDSDKLEVKSVTTEFENLQQIFTEERLTMVHGKMKEKDQIMQEFKNKEYDILVATSVVEVGVDIPDATIMIIEGAERFGISQLHQFRGRVGRNDMQSYCFLFTSEESSDNNIRLKALEKTNNGFELSKVDLQLRGPGEVFGTRQAGLSDFRMADWNDLPMIKKAREWAVEVLSGK